VAIENALENASLNDVDKNIQFFIASPEILQPSKYDIILANINRNVLIKYASLLSEFLKRGGKLILSGILLRDEPQLLQTYQNVGFTLVEKNAMKEWLMLVFELKNKI
jgi:ribosomal protein L11 methyltransferase